MRQSAVWLLLLAAAGSAFGHASYTGYSSAPGRQTCASSCHGGTNGTVTVTGFPELYTPGTPYTISLGRSSGNNIRNFNGSCRLGTGSSNAGAISAGTQTSTYNVAGETNGVHLSSSNQASATFTWTAPAAGAGTARLYVAAYQGSGTGGQTTRFVLVAEEQSEPVSPALELGEVAIVSDDDGDGLAEPGEAVGLQLTLYNTGAATAWNVVGTLMVDSPWAQLTQPVSDWPSIPHGSSRTNEIPFTLIVNPALEADQVITLDLHVEAADYMVDLSGQLLLTWAVPPLLELGAQDPVVLLDDDGDGVVEPGETCALNVTLMNHDSQTLTGIQAVLAGSSTWIEVGGAGGAFPDLLPESGAPANQPFTITVSQDAPPLFDETLVLQVNCDQGEGEATFRLAVGERETVWSTDLEDGEEGWSHAAAEGWNDQWHLGAYGQGSPTHAWKCGAEGDGSYQDHLDARLETPAITLLPASRLSFHHALNAEVSGAFPDSAYDGGVVELSTDGGLNWEQLTPLAGYPHTFRFLTGGGDPTTHPFPGGTPCFSGEIAWEEAVFDLSAYGTSAVLVRFRFGSDNGTGRAGWIIDDPRVVGLHQDTAVAMPQVLPGRLELLPAWPNPFNPATSVAWVMPAAGNARVELFDLGGRRVRTLADGVYGGGRQELRLDGAGLASGAYLLRLSAAGERRQQKVLLLK